MGTRLDDMFSYAIPHLSRACGIRQRHDAGAMNMKGAHLLVNDEQAAQRHAVGREHVVARGDLALQV